MIAQKKLRLALLWFLAGLIMAAYIMILQRSPDYPDMSELADLKKQIVSLQSDNQRLEANLADLQDSLRDTYQSIEEGLSPEELLLKDIADYRLLAGYEEVTGEGVVVLLTDSNAPLAQDQNPNRLIVHDRDITMIINELRNAGAEAISVNGQRYIINRSELYCNGPTIRINDQWFAQPFIIEAIGSRRELLAAINSNTSYAFGLKTRGIFIEANTSLYLTIPAYDGSDYEHLRTEDL
ncbi:MAG TPA: DUF881 domain-containing protein [Tissierellia bacterium]|nr:DUF881 domain-containing protein [Tissierellia bacterium]